jgi:hypothetical protein
VQADRATDIPTGLNSLRHNQIATGLLSRDGLFLRTDLPGGQGTTVVDHRDKVGPRTFV